ncbi:hypothetical protein [Dietzia sp. ANT_WB102]|uniref:hypothetical protein n=1 Tax=Dietzia sp. ANT_WB102 TaxID=2597345 RepID=UPI0011EBE502|nr:hypothetical protein [Dietzia sp. ANT_WB102]KAA0918033.1 hypothetical protein FQ137_01125 [Dietzia sp. ANT_WB102]
MPRLPGPPPPIRTFADLAATRGRARATDGHRRSTMGAWLPDHVADDFQARCAALAFARPEIVVTGWTAARFHGHQWPDSPEVVEVATGRRRLRRPGVLARQYDIPHAEIEEFSGPGGQPIRVASPAWTLFDLARNLERLPAVVALDGSSHFPVDARYAVTEMSNRYPERRGSAAARRAASEADPRAESPKETELRLFLVDCGFDSFVPQVKVPGCRARLDLADRERKIAVEYDGRGHLEAGQHARDLERWRDLISDGWIILPVGVRDLRYRRVALKAQVRAALVSRGWRPSS